VNAILVPDPANPPPEGCQATVDPNAVIDADGVTFHVNATFPCNLVYEVRASAQSNAGTGLGAPPPESRAIPLLVAVAMPPAPVGTIDAEVVVEGDTRSVVLSWPGNGERDLLGYDVRRGGQSIGQVNAGDATRFTDTRPPAAGGELRYEVVAYRQGPDDEVKQVPSRSTSVDVDVPRDPDAPAGSDAAADGDAIDPSNPQLAGQQHASSRSGTPLAGGMSSVRARGQAPPRLGTPTTLDTGFGETLPFDTSGEAAVGDPAVVASFDDGDVMDEKHKLAFIAGGLATLVVAAMIFHVTRRAAREAY
jgi:hypothetical protein